jgi:hypothetical protein
LRRTAATAASSHAVSGWIGASCSAVSTALRGVAWRVVVWHAGAGVGVGGQWDH